MSKCNICEKEVEEVFICKECGASFCREHGDVDTELCDDCRNYELEEKKQEEADIIDDIQDMEQEEHE